VRKAAADAGGWVQRWRVPVVCLVLAAITFAVFGQTLGFGFVNCDDNVYVYENAKVAGGLSMKGLAWVFTHADCFLYHPLTMLSLMADYQFHGLHAGRYHLTNVLLHTASVILLFLILRQMTGALWRSAFVAAVFAIHPLRVESVAWVAERKDVLSAFFFMLTLGAYARYARKPDSPGRYLMVAVAFVLALLSKPTVVTLPFVLLLLDYWPLRRFEQSRKLSGLILEKVPLLALAAAACATTVMTVQKGIAYQAPISMLSRIGNALVSYSVYLRQMVWPQGLAEPYPYPHIGLPPWEVALAGALLAGLSAVACRERRTRPWLLVGWLWYLGMLTPMIGIVQVGEFPHADRMTYLPQIGICVALTWLVAEWRVNRVALGGLMAGVIGALMVCAWIQTAYWKNSETLWNHTLACTRNNDVAHYRLGNALLDQTGRVDEATAHYKRALEIRPDDAAAHIGLGLGCLQQGKPDEAIAHFQKALKINPNFAIAQLNLGNVLCDKGKLDEAISHFERALQIQPDYADVHNSLGTALCQKGKPDEGISHFEQALQIKPGDASAHYNLGKVLLQKGKVDEAISHLQKALQINPDFADAHYNLAIALRQKGNVDEAISHFQNALQINPDNARAQVNLGIALLQAGKVDEAIVHCEKALEIKADDADAHYNLGDALLQKGRMDEAISHFQRALQIKPDYVNAHVNLGNLLLQKGNVDEAISHFQKALQIKPDNAKAQNNLGNALLQKGIVGEAIAHFQKSLQIEPADPSVQNNLAWLLATCPEASLRNGPKAVELAQKANTLTGGANPIILHTLAAAFAEDGQFPEAVETAQRALHLAGAQSNTRLAGALQSELKLYQAGTPFHSPQQTH